MRRYSAVIVLMVLSTGCMHDKKPETQPPPVATTPETATPQPAKSAPATGTKTPSTAKAKPAATSPAKPAAGQPAKATAGQPAKATAGQPAKATASSPAKPATASAKPAPTATAKTTTPPKAAAAPTLDLDGLEARLKQTKAIGLMTKLSLKNQVDDLLGKFRKHYAGNATPTMTELRRSYDLLMMKVLSLLQDHDQQLASDILSSRERIWGLLADPTKFAALQA